MARKKKDSVPNNMMKVEKDRGLTLLQAKLHKEFHKHIGTFEKEALEAALNDPADPFAYSRARSHQINGVASLGDYGHTKRP